MDRGEPALQLTSHQLIIAISALLLWGAVCFVFGIIATKLDMRIRQKPNAEVAQVEEAKTPSAQGESTSKSLLSTVSEIEKTAGSGEGRQTSPRRDVFDSQTSQRTDGTKFGGTSSSTGTGSTTGSGSEFHQPVKVPAPPPQKEQPVGEQPAAGQPSAGQPAVGQPAVGQPKADAVQPAKPAAPLLPLEPMEMDGKNPASPTAKGGEPQTAAGAMSPSPAETSVTVTPATGKQSDVAKSATPSETTGQKPDASAAGKETMPSEKPPVEAKPATGKGGFAVQVASVDAKSPAKAEDCRKQTAKDTGLEVRVAPSEDGKHLRILVGAYPTREAAQKARDELRKRKEFAGCYIQALP